MRRKKNFMGIGLTSFCFLFLTVSAFAEHKDWPKTLSSGSGPIGGTYYVWTTAWANTVSPKLGVKISVESTGGPPFNIQLVTNKQLSFGTVTSETLVDGFQGKGWAKGKKFDQVRILFPMYQSYFHVYAMVKANVKSLKDLDKKIINMGPAGATAEKPFMELFRIHNIKPAKILHMGYADGNNLMRDGMCDVTLVAGGVPHPSVAELMQKNLANLVELTEDDVKELLQQSSYLSFSSLPANSYPGQTKPIRIITVWNFLICHKDFPEDLAYEVVKTTFSLQRDLVKGHEASKETLPENIKYAPIPLHPGAEKYYKEKHYKK